MSREILTAYRAAGAVLYGVLGELLEHANQAYGVSPNGATLPAVYDGVYVALLHAVAGLPEAPAFARWRDLMAEFITAQQAVIDALRQGDDALIQSRLAASKATRQIEQVEQERLGKLYGGDANLAP